MFEKNAYDKLKFSSHNIISPYNADNFIDGKQLNPVMVQDFTKDDNYLIRNKSGSSFYFKLLKFPEHLIEVEYYDNNKKKRTGWLGINHITGDNKTIYKIDNMDEFDSFANPKGPITKDEEPLEAESEGGRRRRKIRITRKVNRRSKKKATRRHRL